MTLILYGVPYVGLGFSLLLHACLKDPKLLSRQSLLMANPEEIGSRAFGSRAHQDYNCRKISLPTAEHCIESKVTFYGLQIKHASRAAAVGTASMGKFDKREKNEAAPGSHMGIKRRKFEPVTGNASKETAQVGQAVLASAHILLI